MSESLNRSIAIRWFEEVWNERRVELVEQFMAPTAAGHMEGAEIVGPEGFRAVYAAMLAAMPDIKVTVEDTVVQGENVVVRWRVDGTHSGHGLGFPPSGKTARFRGMTWMRIENGKMVEGWDAWNQGALIQALRPA